MPRITAPFNVDPSNTAACAMLLRGALYALLNTPYSATRVTLAARDFASNAYCATFSDVERAIVLSEAQRRDETIKDYNEALFRFGTSIILELQEAGKLETPPHP